MLADQFNGEIGIPLRGRNIFTYRAAWPDSKDDGLVVLLLPLAGKHE